MNKTYVAIITMTGIAQLSIIAFFSFLAAKMFEYSLWSIFHKDVPWYLDLLGGCVLNALNLPIFAGCLIARACGVEVPFYG